MLCIYFEVPYRRQLMRIAPSETVEFFTKLKDMASYNGAKIAEVQFNHIFTFIEESIAHVFSCTRFLQVTYKLLQKNAFRFSEYRIVIDDLPTSDTENLIDHFMHFQKKLIPDRGFFVTMTAKQVLKEYMNFQYVPEIDMYQMISFTQPSNKTDENQIEPNSFIVNQYSTCPAALYNFFSMHPVNEKDFTILNTEEKKVFAETKASLAFYKRYRFSAEFPQYLADAFLQHMGLCCKLYRKAYKIDDAPIIYVESIEDEENYKQAEKILWASSSSPIRNMPKSEANIDDIPQDLAELMYTTIVASHYIFADEMEDFFLSLKKNAGFFSDLLLQMDRYGITLIKNNIYSVPISIFTTLEKKIQQRKEYLFRFVASFLWKKYQAGSLHADDNICAIFKTLHSDSTSIFFLHNFFDKYSDVNILHVDIDEYQYEPFYAVIKKYQQALRLSFQGDPLGAFQATKSVLSILQEDHFLAGEYRTFSLLGFLSLQQNKLSDAVTYFDYALDDAESLRDSGFICEALFHIAITYFLQNNISQAQTFLIKLSDAINIYFEQTWKIPMLFLRGRIALKLGEHESAKKIFDEATDLAELYFDQWKTLCILWSARAVSLNGKTHLARKVFLDHIYSDTDAALFFLESLLLSPINNDEISNLHIHFDDMTLNQLHCLSSKDTKISNGYSFAEDFIWGRIYEQSICTKMYQFFLTYYRCRIHLLQNKEEDKITPDLSKLEEAAGQALHINDPFASIYLYLCFDIYSQIEGTESASASAYLSKAFKAMQYSIINIGENSIRQQFMQDNVWNSKLFSAAQNNKLI
ncbi:tetratricopeptide repeat protein [Treponema phagedenis]|uniref:tetratricopeptide repeat protein n=1 Tax=Treponema phagedenis TaxID=162 RepID=UPI0002EED963|nr:hypothetical protein [Treponema phagedenis]